MITDNTNVWNSPSRKIEGKVELFTSSTDSPANTFLSTDHLKSFSIERVGEDSKFFGFGICQKTKIELVDNYRELEIIKGHKFKNYLKSGGDFISAFPSFIVDSVNRDENNNNLTITAYDAIYGASAHVFSELNLSVPYTIRDVAAACASLLGLSLSLEAIEADLSYSKAANFEGTELIREVLNDIAEATLTIYYVDSNNTLVFKRLDKTGEALLTVGKSTYFTLKSEKAQTITGLVSVTELGDNLSAGTDTGVIQYIRDNGFWDLREDRATLLDNAVDAISGLTIGQFECNWRGHGALEIGDKIKLITKDDGLITSFVLNDTISYNGGLSQKTSWKYEAKDKVASNPTSLGETLKSTTAKVDKVNKQIGLVVTESEATKSTVAALQVNTDNISTTVSNIQEENATNINSINNALQTLTNEVETKVTAEQLSIAVKEGIGNGVNKVSTTTGFTFDSNGLKINKDGSKISTTITEDGMKVYKNEEVVLTADNTGVNARNLHATTYLMIGKNSRFEDYVNHKGEDRTGCFWIGKYEVK